METITIAKAIIKYNNQYFVMPSDSAIKKWKFFEAQVNLEQTDIGELSKQLKNKFQISQNIGKLFCEMNYFEMGKQVCIKAYFVNIFDDNFANQLENFGKFLLISELKTIKFENIDKAIFQKIVDANK